MRARLWILMFLLLGILQPWIRAAEPTVAVELQILTFRGNQRGLSEADILAGKRIETVHPETLYLAEGQGEARRYHALQLRSNQLSKRIEYVGPVPLQLYAKRPDGQGGEHYQSVVSLPAEQLQSTVLLLVLHQMRNGDYRCLVFDRSPTRLPPGYVLLVNLSEFPVAASTGEVPVQVASLTAGSFPMSRQSRHRFDLKIAIGEPEGWKRIYAAPVKLRDATPILILVHRAAGLTGQTGHWTVRFLEL